MRGGRAQNLRPRTHIQLPVFLFLPSREEGAWVHIVCAHTCMQVSVLLKKISVYIMLFHFLPSREEGASAHDLSLAAFNALPRDQQLQMATSYRNFAEALKVVYIHSRIHAHTYARIHTRTNARIHGLAIKNPHMYTSTCIHTTHMHCNNPELGTYA